MANHSKIVQHYEECFSKHGDSHLGVDWPNRQDALKRYQVMLDVIRQNGPVTLLDFGSGCSHLLEYIRHIGMDTIHYCGLDMSEAYVNHTRKKFPGVSYYCQDILVDSDIPCFDYIVMNGVLTEKREFSYEEMLAYSRRLIEAVYSKANVGIAFNVMSKAVDWERDDLFHVSLDAMQSLIMEIASRNFIIRNDYGLYEYTVYVYKTPSSMMGAYR